MLLPAYMLLLALLGYMGLTAHIEVADKNDIVPALFQAMFPPWFAGFAFAAVAIGALVRRPQGTAGALGAMIDRSACIPRAPPALIHQDRGARDMPNGVTMDGRHSRSVRSTQLPPEMVGFAAAVIVTFLGVAILGPRLLSVRRSTATRVDQLQRRARDAKRQADAAASEAQAAVTVAARRAGRNMSRRADRVADQARGASQGFDARARAVGRQAGVAGAQARSATRSAVAKVGRRLRQLGGGTILARW